MKDDTFRRLSGIVEVDETLSRQEKERNKHVGERHRKSLAGKVGVIGAIARKGTWSRR